MAAAGRIVLLVLLIGILVGAVFGLVRMHAATPVTPAGFVSMAESETSGMFLMHRPDAGCPENWKYDPVAFSTPSGDIGGCLLNKQPNGSINIDFLGPGESLGLTIPLPFGNGPEDKKGGPKL